MASMFSKNKWVTQKIRDKTSYYDMSEYSGSEKKTIELIKDENKKNLKMAQTSFVLLIFLTIILFSVNKWKSYNFLKNSIITYSILKRTQVDYNPINDMEGRSVRTVNFEYEFKHNEQLIKSRYSINSKDLDQYFDKPYKLNDTLRIRLDKRNPRHNQMIKLDF